MVFMSEFVTYLIKYILLGVIAFAGIMAGISYKKKKNAKAAAESNAESEVTE